MSGHSTILVIGARGFIGSHLSEAARWSGRRVIGASRSAEVEPEHLDRQSAGDEPGQRVDIRCDVEDIGSLERAIEAAAPEEIAIAAGRSSVAASWQDPVGTAGVHVMGTLNALEAARRRAPGAHVLCLSSAEVYGTSEASLGENDPLRPLTPYGAAKLAMEAFGDHYRRVHGQPIAVVRPFNQIGPGLPRGNSVADFVETVARAEAAGEPRAVIGLGNPNAVRDFTDVRDSVTALLEIAHRRLDGIFNLCSGHPTSMLDIVEQLAALSRIEVAPEERPELARPADPAVKVGRPDVLAETIGWQALTPIPETIAEMLAAARDDTK